MFEESLRSPLIISYPGMPEAKEMTDAIVQTCDVFATLTDLAGLPVPSESAGVSLTKLITSSDSEERPALGYFKKAKTIRTDSHRLIAHDDGYLELYDQLHRGG